MEKEKTPETNQENKIENINPNSIGEIVSLGKDLLTNPDKVYRSVRDKKAIDDIKISGIVRNKQSQSEGLVKSRWGERVFWSQGAEGKYHVVQQNGFVIEAPLSVAKERVVTQEDITAIYTKKENNEVIDILKQEKMAKEDERQTILEERKARDAQELADVRKNLGIGE